MSITKISGKRAVLGWELSSVRYEESLNGALRWKTTKWVMVSTSLKEQYVGLEEMRNGFWRFYFLQKMLGYFDEKNLRIMDELGRLKRNNV